MNSVYSVDRLLFVKNRKKLLTLLESNSLAIIHSNDEMPRNGDQYFPFRQDSDLYYLTGVNQEKTILCLSPNNTNEKLREIIFILEPDKKMEIWNGHRYSKDEITELSGVKTVFYLNEFDSILREMTQGIDNIYLLQNELPKFKPEIENRNHRLANEFVLKFPLFSYKRLAPLMKKLRLIKEPQELDIMKKACSITKSAFVSVLKTTKPDMYEYQIEAEITYEFNKNGAGFHAYSPIVASGKNACVLHYTTNNNQCNSGDLVLLDFGAEFNNYAADCSRTIPVNGKFSARQAECYNAVLRVFKELKKLYIPGNTINILNDKANKLMEKEMITLGLFSQSDVDKSTKDNPLYFKYFMHGVSHFIGLDVHDVGDKDKPFEKGMVLTCEPGLYIEEEKIGIRIENDIIVDKVPVDLMEDIPVEIEEIEQMMNN